MILSLIVAMSENLVIGREQKLPWHISEDLKRFRRLTTGHPIVMGRKTYESIGRLLPNRANVIVTRNRDFKIDGAVIASSLDEALKPFENSPEEVFVIGGGELFKQAIGRAERLYLTLIHQEIAGDVFFPELDLKKFKVRSQEKHLTEKIPFSFVDYVRLD